MDEELAKLASDILASEVVGRTEAVEAGIEELFERGANAIGITIVGWAGRIADALMEGAPLQLTDQESDQPLGEVILTCDDDPDVEIAWGLKVSRPDGTSASLDDIDLTREQRDALRLVAITANADWPSAVSVLTAHVGSGGDDFTLDILCVEVLTLTGATLRQKVHTVQEEFLRRTGEEHSDHVTRLMDTALSAALADDRDPVRGAIAALIALGSGEITYAMYTWAHISGVAMTQGLQMQVRPNAPDGGPSAPVALISLRWVEAPGTGTGVLYSAAGLWALEAVRLPEQTSISLEEAYSHDPGKVEVFRLMAMAANNNREMAMDILFGYFQRFEQSHDLAPLIQAATDTVVYAARAMLMVGMKDVPTRRA